MKDLLDRGMDYAKANPGKVIGTTLGVAAGAALGGAGLAIGGTAFGISRLGVSLILGALGSQAGKVADEASGPRDRRPPGG